MSNKLKITKIELTTKDGKKVELSLDEAKDLHGQLDELFGQKSAPYIPYSPIIIDRTVRPWWQPYNPVWGNGTVCCSRVKEKNTELKELISTLVELMERSDMEEFGENCQPVTNGEWFPAIEKAKAAIG